jgi:hypothetical protein
MGLKEFRQNVETALEQLSEQKKGDAANRWLNERALTGMADAALEKFPADLGFRLGHASSRFRRIAKEVAEANGQVEPEEAEEAAAALRTIAEILKSLPAT